MAVYTFLTSPIIKSRSKRASIFGEGLRRLVSLTQMVFQAMRSFYTNTFRGGLIANRLGRS
jgi:hypothetical protein